MGVPLTCRLLEAGIDLSGQVVDMPNPTTLEIYFDPLTLAQYRQLVTLLFVNPTVGNGKKPPVNYKPCGCFCTLSSRLP